MKEKTKAQDKLLQNLDDENYLDNRNLSAKNKKQGHRAHRNKFAENWESDDAIESYVKDKAYAHGGKQNR